MLNTVKYFNVNGMGFRATGHIKGVQPTTVLDGVAQVSAQLPD